MEKGAELVRKVLMHHMSIPALNKWTTVAPCASLVAGQQAFCRVIPDAFEACFGSLEEVSDSSEAADEGAELGQPVDQTKRWRKLARRRQKKAAAFLSDPESQFRTLLWAVLCAPVMRIHYALFKHATWFTERQRNPEGDEVASAFGLVQERHTKRALSALAAIILSTDNAAWLPMVGLYGPVLSWPQARLRTIRRAICTITGQLWRKLEEPWRRYPWKLLGLVGDDEEVRRSCAEDLLGSKPCCLDNFSQKLRSMCPSVEQLLGEEAQHFLQELFERVVPTSTYIERCFARFQKWTITRGHKLKLSQLAAKHYADSMTHLVDIWRKQRVQAGLQQRARSYRFRPQWIRKRRKERARTGLHVFTQAHVEQNAAGARAQARVRGNQGWSAIQQAKRLWSALSQQEKGRWRQQAKLQNAAARSQQRANHSAAQQVQDIAGGPWDIGSSEGFPLARHVVLQNQQRQQEMVSRFIERTQLVQAENLDSLDGAPETECTLFASCGADSCFNSLEAGLQAKSNKFHSLLVHTIMKRSPLPLEMTLEPLVLAFDSESADSVEYCVVAYHTRKSPIEAAILRLEPDGGGELPEGVSMSLRMTGAANAEFQFCSNKALCLRLMQIATDWVMYVLRLGPIRQLWQFDIVGAERVQEDEANHDMGAAGDVARALQALRALDRPKRPAKRKGPGAAPRPQKKKAPGKLEPEEALKPGLEKALSVEPVAAAAALLDIEAEDEDEVSSQGSSCSHGPAFAPSAPASSGSQTHLLEAPQGFF